MENVQVYSEKLDSIITFDVESNEDTHVVTCDDSSSLVGWTHHGWNNAGGGGSW